MQQILIIVIDIDMQSMTGWVHNMTRVMQLIMMYVRTWHNMSRLMQLIMIMSEPDANVLVLAGVQLPDHHEAAVEWQEAGLQGQAEGHLGR